MPKIIFFFILFFTSIAFAGQPDLFMPYSQNYTVLDGPKNTYLNSVKSKTFQYIIHNNSLSTIRDYYSSLLVKSGCKKKEDRLELTQGVKVHYLKFIKDNRIISIILADKDDKDIEIIITSSNNGLIFNEEIFNMNGKKDNPGFDLKDVPRPKDGIRIVSLLNSYDNTNALSNGQGSCNIIYKTKLSMDQAAKFYLMKMKKGWAASHDKKFFQNKKGYWMTFNKANRSCLISILYEEEFKSSIVSIYYGYKK